jgi:hypothetical protein
MLGSGVLGNRMGASPIPTVIIENKKDLLKHVI